MKSLKHILTLSLIAASFVVFAKSVTAKFKVEGQCGDCKVKIEKALDIPGVSYAEWNEETKMLTVRYNDKKITENKIHTIISNIGYSTSKMAANKEAQSKLDACCQPKKTKGKACCSKD
ncbi:MAG: cation transporter [Bacteroidia bacterium]